MATFVLVHGAYQGGWIWQLVAAQLRAAGHVVYAPTLDGCGEQKHQLRAGITTETHGTAIAELLHYEGLRDAVLVGTSTGGMVMCSAAEQGRDRVASLVFADALALLHGESLPDIVSRPTARNTTLASGPSPEDIEDRLFRDLDPDLRSWAVARVTPHPIAAMQAPVSLPTFWSQSWRATVIYCRRSANPPEAHQRRAADRLGAAWAELETGHYPMLSMPVELARLLTEQQ
jgi:pimeloyl-ACP methyl ester carboxylesterase